MPIISQAPVAFANQVIAAGSGSAQQVQVSTAGVIAGLTAGNFTLPIPAEFPIGVQQVVVKAQGYVVLGVTSTIAIGLLVGKTQATATTATFTPVASASLTGANPPVLPTNAYNWQIEQKCSLDAVAQTANIFGPGSGYQLTAGTTLASIWVGAAGVNIAAGYPTQVTGVSFNQTLQPTVQTGINNPTTINNSLFFGITFTMGSSQTTGNSLFVITSFYAVQD